MTGDEPASYAHGMWVTFGDAVLLGQAQAYASLVLHVDEVGVGLVVDFLADERVRALGARTDEFGDVWRGAYETLVQVVESRLTPDP